jgi:hypothetical protein
MSKSSRTNLTVFAGKTPVLVPPPRLDEGQVIGCEYGHYPWDDWERWAIAQGLNRDLAGQGRLLIREAYQHGWDDHLKAHCGWRDDGQALLAHALRFPAAARRQWDILMRTDGLRGDYPTRSTNWTWGFLRADAQRLLAQLSTNDSQLNKRSHAPHS